MQFNISKMMKKDDRGFTLIEVIVSLIVAAILGTMLVSFMGTSVMKSANPVILAKNGAYLNSIMENMSADYRQQMANARIASKSPSEGLTSFRQNVADNTKYGSGYTVVDNYKMTFDSSNNETTTGGNILKVTIKYQGLSATALFTE